MQKTVALKSLFFFGRFKSIYFRRLGFESHAESEQNHWIDSYSLKNMQLQWVQHEHFSEFIPRLIQHGIMMAKS